MVMRVEAVAALNKGETVSEVAGVQEPTFAEVSRASILLTPAMLWSINQGPHISDDTRWSEVSNIPSGVRQEPASIWP